VLLAVQSISQLCLFQLQPGELCLPIDLSIKEMHRLDELSTLKRSFSRNDYLYAAVTNSARCSYPQRSFKTQILHEDGREQVTGFQMTEKLSHGSISTDIHACEAVALEDSVVCELPFNKLETLSRESLHCSAICIKS